MVVVSEQPRSTSSSDNGEFADVDSFEARIEALKGKYDGLFGSSDKPKAAETKPASASPRSGAEPSRPPASQRPSASPAEPAAATRPATTRPAARPPAARPTATDPAATDPASARPAAGTGPARPTATTGRPPAATRPRTTPPAAPANQTEPVEIPDEDVDFPSPPPTRPAARPTAPTQTRPPATHPPAAHPGATHPGEPDLPRLRALLEPEAEAAPDTGTSGPSGTSGTTGSPDAAGSSLDWLAPEIPPSAEPAGPNRPHQPRSSGRQVAEPGPNRRPAPATPHDEASQPARPTTPKPPAIKPQPTTKPTTPAVDAPDFIPPAQPVEDSAAKAPAGAKPAKPTAKTAPAPKPAEAPAPTRGGVAAQVKGLAKKYGRAETAVEAIRGVSLTVAAGEFVAVVGPAGAGKSSLLYCVAGLIQPSGGTVVVADQDITSLSDDQRTKLRRDKIATLLDKDNLIPTLTAAENIRLPLQIARQTVDQAWFDRVVATFDLVEVLNLRPKALSGAQQQRVAAARAVMTRPTIIVADEPGGALDTASASDLMGYLRQAVDELGQTVILATSDAAAASFAHRVVFLLDGELAGSLDNASAEAIHQHLARLTQGV